MARRRVFVTGGTGLIGRALVERLVAQGDEVVALYRNERDRNERGRDRRGLDPRVRWREGELSVDCGDLEGAMSGCEVVFHLAGLVDPGHPPGMYRRVNAEGTQIVLRAAEKASVERFVYMSSVGAYRFETSRVLTEASALGPTNEPYGESKALAERYCREARGLSVRILRPTIVYGPGRRGFLPAMVEALRAKKLRLIGDGQAPVHLVHIDDVVDATLRCGEDPAADGQAYNLNGPDRLSWRQLFSRVCAHLEIPVPGSVPVAAAMAMATLMEGMVKLGVMRSAPLTRGVVRLLSEPVHFATDKIAAELGCRATRRLDDMLEPALASMTNQPRSAARGEGRRAAPT